MKELFALYAWTFPASLVFGGALALLGGHLASRNREMQTLCVSQGAVFGVLLSIGLIHVTSGHEDETRILPTVGALLFATITFLATNAWVKNRAGLKGAIYASVFAFLIAIGYLTTALFPALESHMSQAYFGDLATMTASDSQFSLGFGLVACALFAYFWKAISNQSFEISYFGNRVSAQHAKKQALLFNALALLLIAYAIQTMGFLYAISCLFIPTTLFSMSGLVGLRRHLALSFAAAAIASPLGLAVSLVNTRLPTVPTISVLLFVVGLVLIGITRLFSRSSG